MNALDRLIPRLKKIGIEIELAGNYPWIYLEKVNGNEIQEEDYYFANHGFTIAFYQKKEILDIKKTFQIIRKYA